MLIAKIPHKIARLLILLHMPRACLEIDFKMKKETRRRKGRKGVLVDIRPKNVLILWS
jgi:hypothetical protein